ncbi:MAG: hypothetical protein KDI88_11755 [Gammaproteobacteria bacterium]|nr:hypothetical protein [Gammaproteobacteria bacterium]
MQEPISNETTWDSAVAGSATLASPEEMIGLCGDVPVSGGLDGLVGACDRLMPGLSFRHVLTRGHWHRLGGVVDQDLKPVARNIVHWAEQESGGDVDELVARFSEAHWFATHIAGRTHFLTASRGDDPEAFVQLEVEELREIVARPLIIEDWFPDSIEEFLEPLDFPRSDPRPIGDAHYQFRRLVSVADIVHGTQIRHGQAKNLHRFLSDWHESSAGEHATFCDHWVLALREYVDSDGETRLTARPVSTFDGDVPALPEDRRLHGAELANALHGFDRVLGYPFAWYFSMLRERADHHQLAESVLADLMGAYDYLPRRDLRLLRAWEERPYAV